MVKYPPANAGDTGSIPELGRSPGVGNGNPLQYPGGLKSMGSHRVEHWAFLDTCFN